MKKIALIMDSWRRFITYAWLAGIQRRIHETGEDISLYIFNSSGNWSHDKGFNQGEYNIYNLPDFCDFDGIILDLNNINYKDVCNNVIEKARASKKPVISIANDVPGFYYAGIDNYQAMQEIIGHFHEVHGCKRFWFLMGPADNYESVMRRDSLLDYVIEHNLEFDEREMHCCKGFDYRSGREGFEKLLEGKDYLPDAIICANDNIAVAVCEVAKEKGWSVPEDFLVSGFDNFDKAAYFQPNITTVSHVREDVGYLCADMFIRMWAGEVVEHFTYTKTELICQESCGCNKGISKDVRKHLRDKIMYGIESKAFEEAVLALESEMGQCNTIEEMMYCIPQCIPTLKCDAMYLVLDEHINAYRTDQEEVDRFRILSEDGFQEHGYPEKLRVYFAYENGELSNQTGQEISGIFPMFDSKERGRDFLFIPLHFGSRTIGFFTIENAGYLMEKQYLFQIINTLTSAMENLYKKERLEYMNRKLSSLYLTDQMTGLYNRMGYQKMGENFYQIMRQKEQQMSIFFIDLDRLKYINDSFGHEYGDYAIMATAKAIRKYCDTDAVPARTGGDEFVIFQLYHGEEETKKVIHNIRMELEAEEKAKNLPFPLSISAGAVSTTIGDGFTLADYVKLADGKMYEEKRAKRVARE